MATATRVLCRLWQPIGIGQASGLVNLTTRCRLDVEEVLLHFLSLTFVAKEAVCPSMVIDFTCREVSLLAL